VRSSVKRWLREPLLQFLVAGALLFAAYRTLHPEAHRPTEDNRIEVTADDLRQLERRYAAPQIIQTRPAGDAVEVSIDPDCRQLHELVERPLLRMLNQTIDFKLPGRQIDFGRSMRVEHRPFLRARLSRRHAILASRVRADDVGFRDLIGLPRIARLVLWIFV